MATKKVNGRRRRKPASRSVRQRDGSPSSPRRAATGKAPPASKSKSKPEEQFEAHLRAMGFRDFVREHKFFASRRWRVDFAWVEQKVAIEIEGGVWMRGRHVRPAGFISDCEKYNAATFNGWRVYRIPVVTGWLDAAMGHVYHERLT